MRTPVKIGLLGTLYFSQGLPFGFFTQALPVLMRQHHLSLEAIGLANLLALPWALKFLWAPLVDRHAGSPLGPRRGYILPLQLGAVAVLVVLGALRPAGGAVLWALVGAVLLTNLLAATQDIATDALAVDLLAPAERGLGNGVQVAGYRVGMIAGGGLLLILFERLGWTLGFVSMAAALALATVPIALYREPRAPRAVAELADLAPPSTGAALLDWLRRPGALRWLGLLMAFKAGEALATGMLRTFLVDIHLDLEDIGWLLGTVGFAAGLLGALAGGAATGRLGRRAALVLFGVFQSLAVAAYALLALRARGGRPSDLLLYGVVAVEHLASGTATAALFTSMMDLCRPGRAATDYTVQASVVVVVTGGAAALSGVSAARLGYPTHFAVAAAISLLAAAWALLYRPKSPDLALLGVA